MVPQYMVWRQENYLYAVCSSYGKWVLNITEVLHHLDGTIHTAAAICVSIEPASKITSQPSGMLQKALKASF
jgi:hypothetical protein